MDRHNKTITEPHICFVFICQEGELELKALLLGLSLRRYLQFDAEIVAAVPTPESAWGAPDARTVDALETLGIRVEYITNPIGADYPIGNKLACLEIQTKADRVVFLDSDIMVINDIVSPREFSSDRFVCAKPADLASIPADGAYWQPLLRLFNLPFGNGSVSASVTAELMPPYFNAGFINARTGSNFATIWIDTAARIKAAGSLSGQYGVHLDQVSLSIALMRARLDFDCISEKWNFPAHLKPLNASRLPVLVHYHWGFVVRREPALTGLARELAESSDRLRELMTGIDQWKSLTAERWVRRPENAIQRVSIGDTRPLPDAVITGIPRSGTSFLCNAFHKVEDCVAINEPKEIFAHLMNERHPWGLATYYLDLRRDVNEGVPIENKVVGDQVVQDTRLADHREFYSPTVTGERFVLVTKNTLAYLSRIAQIRRALPHAPIFACVRHPVDTIKSWETSFQHLGGALVEEWPIGGVNDEALSGWRRSALRQVSRQANPLLRRALLWNYLAELILDNQQDLQIVHYEKLVSDPEGTVGESFAKLQGQPRPVLREPLTASEPVSHASEFDDTDLDLIKSLCYQYAYELGYEI